MGLWNEVRAALEVVAACNYMLTIDLKPKFIESKEKKTEKVVPWWTTTPEPWEDCYQGVQKLWKNKQQVILVLYWTSYKMVANVLRSERPPTKHRRSGLSLHHQRDRRLGSVMGNCKPWLIKQCWWPWWVALFLDLQCTQICLCPAKPPHICNEISERAISRWR